MKPCTHCHRHMRLAESRCPFCGAALHDAIAPSTIAAWGLGVTMLVACGPSAPPVEPGISSSSSSDSTSTTGTAEPTTTTTTGTTGTTTTTEATCGDACVDSMEATAFIYASPVADNGNGAIECDVFTQDCEDGQKCAAWAEGGGSAWNATRCVPVTGDNKPGDPCTAEPGTTGVDDCAKGAMCWDLDEADHGVCVQLCTGDEDSPECSEPKQACAISGPLNLCLDVCEPLVQDCSGDDLCLPLNQSYVCILDASGDMGATFDPCEYANACDKGLLCISPASALECDQGATGCCLPMCSIAEGGAACPGADQQCFPIYDPQPPGFEDVGYCSLAP